MEKGLIYDSAREQTLNLYSKLQMLEDEGKDVGELKGEAWQRLLAYAEEDKEEQLARLREELLTYTELKKELKTYEP
jgi:hypothetical protein